ncbi:hypothetical protein Sjap_016182 [Stephania japonica]|uniref:Uncharacterized protein n=1 Tax=Stephania japonica TaxID=461633 RepID=A0AAP0NTJ8_9MAGN
MTLIELILELLHHLLCDEFVLHECPPEMDVSGIENCESIGLNFMETMQF